MANATKVSKDELIEALRLRYDYYSATTMFELARDRAGLADQAAYDAEQVRALRRGLEGIGDRLAAVDTRLELLLGGAGAGAEAARPAAEAARPAVAATPAAPAAPEAPAAPAAPEAGEAAAPEAAAPATLAAESKAAAPPRRSSSPDLKARKPRAARGAAEEQEVTLVVLGAKVRRGAELLVCGGGEALGDWDAEQAVPMTRTEEGWVATIKAAPGAELEFKFLQRGADGEVAWEDGDNRSALAAERVECAWTRGAAQA